MSACSRVKRQESPRGAPRDGRCCHLCVFDIPHNGINIHPSLTSTRTVNDSCSHCLLVCLTVWSLVAFRRSYIVTITKVLEPRLSHNISPSILTFKTGISTFKSIYYRQHSRCEVFGVSRHGTRYVRSHQQHLPRESTSGKSESWTSKKTFFTATHSSSSLLHTQFILTHSTICFLHSLALPLTIPALVA